MTLLTFEVRLRSEIVKNERLSDVALASGDIDSAPIDIFRLTKKYLRLNFSKSQRNQIMRNKVFSCTLLFS